MYVAKNSNSCNFVNSIIMSFKLTLIISQTVMKYEGQIVRHVECQYGGLLYRISKIRIRAIGLLEGNFNANGIVR